MSIIKKIEEIKDVMDLFLVRLLQNEDNLVIDSQDDEDNVVVFNRDIRWKWSNNDDIIHIWDNKVEVFLDAKEIEEDEDSLDRLYVDDCLLTVL